MVERIHRPPETAKQREKGIEIGAPKEQLKGLSNDLRSKCADFRHLESREGNEEISAHIAEFNAWLEANESEIMELLKYPDFSHDALRQIISLLKNSYHGTTKFDIEDEKQGEEYRSIYELQRQWVENFFERNLEKIEKAKLPEDKKSFSTEAITEYALHNSSEEKVLAAQILYRNHKQMEKDLRTGNGGARGFGLILAYGTEEQEKDIQQKLIEYVGTHAALGVQDRLIMYHFLNALFNSQWSDKSQEGLNIVRGLFKQVLDDYNVSADKFLNTWLDVGYQPRDTYFHLQSMASLEKSNPGIVSFLFKNFGITNFHRYSAEILIKQYEQYEDTDVPYGVVILPYSDHNGAFESAWLIKDLDAQLKDKYAIRIFECGSKQDIGRALLSADKKYNPNHEESHKISFALIGGHGSKETIQFGARASNLRSHLTYEDLAGKGVSKTGSFFKKNSTIVLKSCSTGAQGGIGQRISEISGLTVIGPPEPTSVSGITATETDKGLVFDVVYDEQNKNVYQAGQLVNS